MKLLPVTEQAVQHICLNLRTQDRVEIFATRWDDDPEALANDLLIRAQPFCWCVGTDDGEPVMLMGIHQLWPGMWSPWAMGTARFGEIALSATKFVRRVVFPTMKALGMHRAECRSLSSNTVSHRWLRILGALHESTNPRMGREGETFYTFVFYPECI